MHSMSCRSSRCRSTSILSLDQCEDAAAKHEIACDKWRKRENKLDSLTRANCSSSAR